jgi:hypothetical protein
MGKFYFGITGMIAVGFIDMGFVEILSEAGGNDDIRLKYGD